MFAGQEPHWDVYISHRGADKEGTDDKEGTNFKKMFVSCLHAHLEQAGVKTFLDEGSLKPGDPGWQVMQDAVPRCRIALPVFTADYGNPEHYLQEVAIMADAPGVTVMPLFLDERLSEVIYKLQGALGGAASAGGCSSAKAASGYHALVQDLLSTSWHLDQTNG